MARGRPPLFLQPEPYRQRRLIDAARVLPVFGAFLFVVPMVLLPKGEPGSTREALIYLFVLWLLLVVFSALITRYIRRAERATQALYAGEGRATAGQATSMGQPTPAGRGADGASAPSAPQFGRAGGTPRDEGA